MDTALTAFVTTTMLPQADPGGFALGDFWSLTQQAGPLRWPIFFILAFGLVQVFLKLYELIRDRRVSKALMDVDLTTASLDDVSDVISQQEESMLATLQSTMINVFRTRPGEGLLHDEISNFVAFQQDQFGVFRRRMEFLSDTAGALGLMGTVWGMFTVFFQGTAEQDVILRGMGIALITTLLGLVVSIILNFSATELSTFFDRRLEQVSVRSDELRFRLMELAPRHLPQLPAALAMTETPAQPAEVAIDEAAVARHVAELLENGTPPSPNWRYVEVLGGDRLAQAGEGLQDLTAVVKGADGEVAAGVPVTVTIVGTGGALQGGARKLQVDSDGAGRVQFDCTVPERAGLFALDVALPEQPGPPVRMEVIVRPGAPHRIDQEGNNQAAVAGMKLPMPLGIRVFDQFGNPVPGVPVGFAVKQGGGKLGTGQQQQKVTTDSKGRANAPFVVSSEAGPNLVTADIDGTGESVEFVAFGTQV